MSTSSLDPSSFSPSPSEPVPSTSELFSTMSSQTSSIAVPSSDPPTISPSVSEPLPSEPLTSDPLTSDPLTSDPPTTPPISSPPPLTSDRPPIIETHPTTTTTHEATYTKPQDTPTTTTVKTSVLSTIVIPVTLTSQTTNSLGQVFTTSYVTNIPTTTLVPPPPASSQNSNQAAIIGGAVGGAAGFILCIFLIVFFMRRKRKNDLLDDPINWPDFNAHGIGSNHPVQSSQMNADDDGMGGRLAGSEIGAGVVIPYQYNNDSRTRSSKDERSISPHSSYYSDAGYAGPIPPDMRGVPHSSAPMAFATLASQQYPTPPVASMTSFEPGPSRQSVHSGTPLLSSSSPRASSVGSGSWQASQSGHASLQRAAQGSLNPKSDKSPQLDRSGTVEPVVHVDGGSVPSQPPQPHVQPEELPPQYDTIPGNSSV